MKRLKQNTMYRTPAIPPNHKRAVTPASSLIRQRSRAMSSALSWRGSGGRECRAMSSCKAWISSCSLMLGRPLHHAPQRAFGIVNPRPHRAELAAGNAGDVFVGHFLDEAKQEHFPVFRRQSPQGGVDALRVFGREVVVLSLPSGEVDPVQRGQRLAPFSQLAQ